MGAKNSSEHDYRMGENAGAWLRYWQIPAVLAVIGLVLSFLSFSSDADRFGYSYLFAMFAILTFVFGALFLVIIQHFTAGYWGVTTRRIVEVVMSGAPVVAVLAIPLFAGVASGSFGMYDEWMGHHGESHGEHDSHDEGHDNHGSEDPSGESDHGHDHDHEGEHGSIDLFGAAPAYAQDHDHDHAGHDHGGHGGHGDHADDHEGGHAHTPQMEAAHHRIIEGKSAYLNATGWYIRAAAYFIIWIGLALFFWRKSREQDESKDLELTNKMKAFTPIASVLYGLTLTFAAFDWLMSLEAAWYSTIFGVVIFGGSAVAILGFTTIIGISFFQRGLTHNAINTEHVHDLGKLLFGFMCFWTYVSFSQWMLIWYAGIPEEATWFHKRWEGGWHIWSVALVLGHFVFPFFFLISRVVKRNMGLMFFGAAWLIGMHIADVYWYVLPQAGPLQVGLGDVGALLFVGGVFFAYVLYTFTKVPLVPVGDPRLQRCIDHHQSH